MATTNRTKLELTDELYRAIEQKSFHVISSGAKALVVNKHIPVSVAFDWRDLAAAKRPQTSQNVDLSKPQATAVEELAVKLPKEREKSSFTQTIWGFFHEKTPISKPTAPTEEPTKTTNKRV